MLKIRPWIVPIVLISVVLFCNHLAAGQTIRKPSNSNPRSDADVVNKATELIESVRQKSFPEIFSGDIKIEKFHSESVFFKARFSFSRFLTFRRLKTTIYVNPKVFESTISDEAIMAIMAHELAHALYYTGRNRFALLGLVRLLCDNAEAVFERKADLAAINRGFGKGLTEYREWLYIKVPVKNLEKKRRNYFSPAEIILLVDALESDPKLYEKLRDQVPRNMKELVRATKKY